jgi:hypothetical protein
MIYLVLRKDNNKVLKQFTDLKEAHEYAHEMKQKYMVVLVKLDTTTYQTCGAIIY